MVTTDHTAASPEVCHNYITGTELGDRTRRAIAEYLRYRYNMELEAFLGDTTGDSERTPAPPAESGVLSAVQKTEYEHIARMLVTALNNQSMFSRCFRPSTSAHDL